MKTVIISSDNIRNYKHGGDGTKMYDLWISIKQRCTNSNKDNYKYYGGRGITICPEWTNDYTKFRDWSLNNGYADNLQINRIKNDGNYEPSNCNFITSQENNQNQSSTKLTKDLVMQIKILSTTRNYTQKELAKKFNVSQVTISNIINKKCWGNIKSE